MMKGKQILGFLLFHSIIVDVMMGNIEILSNFCKQNYNGIFKFEFIRNFGKIWDAQRYTFEKNVHNF